jgi:hypothetical protein
MNDTNHDRAEVSNELHNPFTCDVEVDTMKTKAMAVVAGALVTLFLWAIAFVVLNGIYRGDFPWLITGLAAFLCPLVGGYVAGRLDQTNGARLGTLSGGGAGLIVLLAAAIVSGLAPNTTLAGIGLAFVWAVCGGLGAHVTRT